MKFEDAKKKSCACVYRLNFPDGKCYVGQTKNLSDRMCLYLRNIADTSKSSKVIEALRNFGTENISVDILSEPKNLSDKDKVLVLSILEIKYIRENDSIYPNGYNISMGGELLGIPIDCITTSISKSSYSGGYKPVLVYDLDGNFIEEFESIEKCAYNYGVDASLVSSNMDKYRSAFCGKYMLRQKKYGKVPQKIIPFKRDIVEKKIVNKIYEDKVVYRERIVSAPRNSILKYNEEGDFCGEYETITDAALSIGRSYVIKGVLTKGYIFFEHDGGEIKQNIGKIEKKTKRLPKYSDAIKSISDESFNTQRSGWSQLINDFKVGQYTREGELLNVYDNIKTASYETGIAYSAIWACVFGRTRTARGFIWRKYEE